MKISAFPQRARRLCGECFPISSPLRREVAEIAQRKAEIATLPQNEMKVLLAIDDSEYSAAAIKEVARRPWPAKTIVRVLSVVEPVPPPAAELWYDARGSLELAEQQIRKQAIELTESAVKKLKGKNIKVESIVRNGDARAEIVDEARKWSADLIILGSHGYTGIKRLLLGSVALSVVTHADCSVEVVRERHVRKRR